MWGDADVHFNPRGIASSWSIWLVFSCWWGIFVASAMLSRVICPVLTSVEHEGLVDIPSKDVTTMVRLNPFFSSLILHPFILCLTYTQLTVASDAHNNMCSYEHQRMLLVSHFLDCMKQMKAILLWLHVIFDWFALSLWWSQLMSCSAGPYEVRWLSTVFKCVGGMWWNDIPQTTSIEVFQKPLYSFLCRWTTPLINPTLVCSTQTQWWHTGVHIGFSDNVSKPVHYTTYLHHCWWQRVCMWAVYIWTCSR